MNCAAIWTDPNQHDGGCGQATLTKPCTVDRYCGQVTLNKFVYSGQVTLNKLVYCGQVTLRVSSENVKNSTLSVRRCGNPAVVRRE